MNELTNFANPVAKTETFDQIQIGLASPERGSRQSEQVSLDCWL